MAKADFACAECGASVRISGYNRSDADRKAAWHESEGHVCDDCAARRRAAENAKAAVTNQSRGLPALTGSEKQVAWAETIRCDAIALIEKAMPYIDEGNTARAIAEAHPGDYLTVGHHVSLLQRMTCGPLGIEAVNAFVRVLRRQTSARWWIDTRDTVYIEMARTLEDQLRAELTPPAPPSEAQKEAEAEALLKPAGDPASAQIAEIRYVAPFLRVVFQEKNETLRLEMRDMGFSWAKLHWERVLDFRSGDPLDRMAEVAHRLIGKGFMVRVHHEAARAKAIAGDFTAEQRRWITKGVGEAYDGWCKIAWPKSDDLYAPAKRILGARYKDGAIYAPPSSIEEVAEFADKYGFAMSETPRKMLDEHRAALARGVIIADPKPAPAPLRVIEDGSDSPYCLHLVAEQTDRLLPEDNQGGGFVVTVWTRGGEKLRLPGKYRVVAAIPCLEPWSVQ